MKFFLMSLVRPLPKQPWWSLPVTVVVIIATFLAAGLLNSPWPFLALALIVIIGEIRGFRCPDCKRRLKSRDIPVQGGPAYKVFYECVRCATLYDGQMTFDPSQD